MLVRVAKEDQEPLDDGHILDKVTFRTAFTKLERHRKSSKTNIKWKNFFRAYGNLMISFGTFVSVREAVNDKSVFEGFCP